MSKELVRKREDVTCDPQLGVVVHGCGPSPRTGQFCRDRGMRVPGACSLANLAETTSPSSMRDFT